MMLALARFLFPSPFHPHGIFSASGPMVSGGSCGGKRPTRDDIAQAVAKCLFIKPSQQDTTKFFENVGAAVDWEGVRHYTWQAVRSPAAAATLSSHFTAQLAVLDAMLEPQLFIGGAGPCLADLALSVALHACFTAFDDEHKRPPASAYPSQPRHVLLARRARAPGLTAVCNAARPRQQALALAVATGR